MPFGLTIDEKLSKVIFFMHIKYFIFFFTLLSNINFFSNDFSIKIIGQSVNKKNIEMYKFGNGHNIMMIIAGIHGDELKGINTLFSLIELVKNKEIKISSDKQLWVIPVFNPDGFEKKKRENDNNVDLNRNFYTDNWKPQFYYYSKLKHAGAYPFSEPETSSLKDLFDSIENKTNIILLTLHSDLYSDTNLIIPGNNSIACMNFCLTLEQNSTCKINKLGLFDSGEMTDWLTNKMNIISSVLAFNSDSNEIDDIKKIFISLQKIDFKEQFFKYNLNQPFDNKNDNVEYLIQNLPENIVHYIYSNNNIDEFKKLFLSVQDNEELLLFVNKKNFLSNNYIPDDLIEVNNIFKSNKKAVKLRKILINDMEEMITDANNESIDLVIISAYRSYETQKNLFEYWKKELGEKEAKRVSAFPGASQHQLGTAIDFNALDTNFGEAKEGKWLAKNAYIYGFVISYPKGLEDYTGYKYEPWHYRYIGREASLLVYKYFDNNLELFLNWYWNNKNL